MTYKPEYPTRIARHNLTLSVAGNYAAADQVGDLCVWSVVNEAGTKAGVIISVMGWMNAQATQPELDIFLFDRTATLSADNSPAAFATYILRDHLIGVVNVPATEWKTDANTQAFSVTTTLPAHWYQEGAPGRVYGAVVTRTAYTPVALTISLGVLVD